MLDTIRHLCSNCQCTQRFLDCGDIYVCERCNKRLWRTRVADAATPAPIALSTRRSRTDNRAA